MKKNRNQRLVIFARFISHSLKHAFIANACLYYICYYTQMLTLTHTYMHKLTRTLILGFYNSFCVFHGFSYHSSLFYIMVILYYLSVFLVNKYYFILNMSIIDKIPNAGFILNNSLNCNVIAI